MTQTLNDKFNIDCTDVEVITSTGDVVIPQHDSADERVEYDYNKTRNNLHSLLQQGQEALQAALEVAKSSEHPRAFEVVGNLVKQLADVNHQLLELSERRQKLVEKKPEETKQVTNNNAIFVGTTADLSRMLKNLNGE